MDVVVVVEAMKSGGGGRGGRHITIVTIIIVIIIIDGGSSSSSSSVAQSYTGTLTISSSETGPILLMRMLVKTSSGGPATYKSRQKVFKMSGMLTQNENFKTAR